MSKFKIGDRVRLLNNVGTWEVKGELGTIVSEDIEFGESDWIIKFDNNVDGWEHKDLNIPIGHGFLVYDKDIELIEERGENNMKIRIKYFDGATKLNKISKGNWIDVYANKDVFVAEGDRAMIPLGFALELPKGWEGHLAPRSSTFKTWGIIQTNHVGVVDDSYIGDNDQWHMPIYCLQGKDTIILQKGNNGINLQDYDQIQCGTWIKAGDKIGQFRIMEIMPEIEFEEVDTFGNEDRGGFGTTGTK